MQLIQLFSHVGASPRPQTSLFALEESGEEEWGWRGCFQANCAAFRVSQELGGRDRHLDSSAERHLKLSPTLETHLWKSQAFHSSWYWTEEKRQSCKEWQVGPNIVHTLVQLETKEYFLIAKPKVVTLESDSWHFRNMTRTTKRCFALLQCFFLKSIPVQCTPFRLPEYQMVLVGRQIN